MLGREYNDAVLSSSVYNRLNFGFQERGDGDAVKLMEEKTPKIPMLAKQPTSQIPQVSSITTERR